MAKEINSEKKEQIDLEDIKIELKQYITYETRNAFNDFIEVEHKKIIKEKNKKIFWNNFIIFILLVLIVYLVFLLFKNDYFNKYIKNLNDNYYKDNINNVENSSDKIINDKDSYKLSLEDLKKKYSYLLDNIIISDNCDYLSDFYNHNITYEMKNYISLYKLEFNNLKVEDEYNIISSRELSDMYKKIFNDEFQNISFVFNGNKVRYISQIDSYITDYALKKEDSNIKREIIDIKEIDGDVIITTVEGIVKNNKLYNILDKNEIEEYKGDSITNYKNQLNVNKYRFKDGIFIGFEV